MDLETKLEIIDGEIAKGLKLRAIDKLRNLINYYPDEHELWAKLAELYYDSGFLDAAGKYWILTQPAEERIKACVELYEKSVNLSGNQILKDITFRGDRSKLTEYARAKLEALEANSMSVVGSVPTYTRKYYKPYIPAKPKAELTLSQKTGIKFLKVLGIFAVILIVVIFAVGIQVIWSSIFR